MEGYISHRPEREKEINQKLLAGMSKAVLIVERQAKEDCPVDTGRLRASINSRVETENNDIVGIVGTVVEYAPFVEFGTSKMSAKPFLFPALEMKKGEVEEALRRD